MYKGHRVAVVMPIHNEQRFLARAISRVPAYVDVLIAVDDGSTDESWQVLQNIPDKRLIPVRHSTNLGVGAATKTGYARAAETDTELIAVMDGDGQMDASDLPRLLDCALSGVDYVKGNRFLDRQSIRNMPLMRYSGNKALSWLTHKAVGLRDRVDAQCGYTVIQSRVLERLDLRDLYDRYGFLNDLLFLVARTGLTINSVPVKSVYQGEVSGINPFKVVPIILLRILLNYTRDRIASAMRARMLTGAPEGAGD